MRLVVRVGRLARQDDRQRCEDDAHEHHGPSQPQVRIALRAVDLLDGAVFVHEGADGHRGFLFLFFFS